MHLARHLYVLVFSHISLPNTPPCTMMLLTYIPWPCSCQYEVQQYVTRWITYVFPSLLFLVFLSLISRLYLFLAFN